MKDRLPALIALFMLLALVGITWWAADYAERIFALQTEEPAVSKDPDAWSGHFTMLQSDENGIAVTRLDGSRLRHFPHDGSYEIDEPELISQRPDSPRIIASSDIAYAYNNVTLVHMIGNAHAYRFETPDNSALDISSEKLIVYPDDDILETDQPAVVIQGNSRLVGDGMKYNNNTRKLDVYANTGVRMAPDDTPSSNNSSN